MNDRAKAIVCFVVCYLCIALAAGLSVPPGKYPERQNIAALAWPIVVVIDAASDSVRRRYVPVGAP